MIPFGVSLAVAAAESLLAPTIFRQRNIGGFVADVTIEEHARDELTVTKNPVEQGAAITDHAFKRQPRLTIRTGWSNSSQQSLGDPNYVQDIYDQFLTMQAARVPISVMTGKRQYDDMMILALDQVTDEKTENALMLVVELEQILLVTTQTVTVPSSLVMKAPGVTGATQNLGTNQLVPGSNFNTAAAPP